MIIIEFYLVLIFFIFISLQSPHWIVQVSREPYVWRATLQLFVYLRDLFSPTTVHFDPDLSTKIKGNHALRLLDTGMVSNTTQETFDATCSKTSTVPTSQMFARGSHRSTFV
ncbi:hypothetical protein CRE_26002 [Caenorhabditis remanei]|uniref:Uncharacterized protein n=1 Tax=Caenorhabditis remanei TaxID=31234 RepID=E3NRQ4_CAERE|nr:hypothetical protein CRE_26002 [Caenorhabditis remanei]